MRWLKKIGIGLGILLLLLILVPLIIPVPPLENIKTVDELADQDSHFIDVDGLQVHYKISGTSEESLVLLHGFGASVFSWREVMPSLSDEYQVLTYDRPAFGLTDRPDLGEWQGDNPYALSFQDSLLIDLMDALDIDDAVLVGNSMGGTVAFRTALEYPDRVKALILVDPAFGGSETPFYQQILFKLPQIQHLGPWIVRSISKRGNDTIRMAWHDPSKIGEDVFAGYRKPLQAPNWDQALWDLTVTRTNEDLLSRVNELVIPVLVITGDDDRIVPTQSTIDAAKLIPDSELVILENCGHVPQEECPEAFLAAVHKFLNELAE